MGECNYCIVAQFKNKPSEKKQKAIKDFFREGSQAEYYWQDHRSQTSQEFWPAFRTLFPVVTEYLQTCTNVFNECFNGNSLSGLLNFGTEDEIDNMRFYKYFSYEPYVWHMADWGPLAKFMKTKFEATLVWTGSEEDGDSVDKLILEIENEKLKKENRRLKRRANR